ncbi:conjugal transfer protein TraB [Halomonas sp. LBP4]|nr:TraB/VirB10 family protein [Halomonas sp. LBP4]PXX95989.1 conjugal transfer protein TraB [Halomonas sp. LBP4]
MGQHWERLSPRNKRIVAVGGGLALLLGVIAIFSGGAEERERRGPDRDVVQHVLTDRDTRDVSIDGLAAQIQIAKSQNDDLRQELDSVRRVLERTERSTEGSQEMRKEIDSLQEQIEMLIDQNMDLMSMANEPRQSGGQAGYDGDRFDGNASEADDFTATPEDEEQNAYEVDPDAVFKHAPLPRRNTAADAEAADPRRRSGETEEDGDGGENPKNGVQIISSYQDETEEEREAREAAESEDEGAYLPAGSILTGVMLNGMDAPTSQGSRRDPFPSTLRIQHEAILPNRFRADVKECFLIVSGYGDLSSERAYLRGETISCIRDDGGVIEARVDSYAVGEDGKAGVRGRLVSKQGAMIARSMMAGFMSGAANAFDVDAVPVIQTGSVGDQTQYQSNFSPSMFQGAAAQGASNALDRIAQFYVDMAEGIFPVIEVDAGRQIELILTRGTKLQIQ